MASGSRLERPGFGLPLEQLPPWQVYETWQRFPHAIADFLPAKGVTVRERRMLDFINQITDKPRWWEKIHDEEIVAKWRLEACGEDEMAQRTSSDVLDHKCFDYCMLELRDKASYRETYGVVHVLDVMARVVKSDLGPGDDFWISLRQAVKPLEDVPDGLKDWHPGSDDLVLDLLHPSLFPLQYGRSRVLPQQPVPLIGCVEYIGLGEICPIPAAVRDNLAFKRDSSWAGPGDLKPWGSYQWLPAEIRFGDNGESRIDSYVNNLHPDIHSTLYKVFEQAVDMAVPLWNECLSSFHNRTRIEVDCCNFNDFITPTYPGYDIEKDYGMDQEEHYVEWLWEHPDERLLFQPGPELPYVSVAEGIEGSGRPRVDLRTGFPGGLQIIFKLANIHLTPEKPAYDGSNWHVEGALNEHICATALFYYDSENITDSPLEFRQHVDAEDMMDKPPQNEYPAAEDLYGVKQNGPAIQHLGKVLTRPGRWLAFPNVLQHKVGNFSIKDSTQPGHRKILAMFLVDPHIPVLSTANVPPQRLDWWAEKVRKMKPFADLPVELFDRIMDLVEDFPINWSDACKIREELMAERGRITKEYDDMLKSDTFFFCEH